MAIVVLPGLGFPASVLLVLAGAIWPTAPWVSCLLATVALCLNVTWTHLFASRFPVDKARKLLPLRWRRLLDLKQEDHVRVACILRFTPGIPLFVQNYALALCGVSLRHSLGIGLPVQMLWVCGFVLTGGAIFEGRVGLAIAGVGLLVAGSVVVRMLRRSKIQARRPG